MAVQAQHPSNILFFSSNGQEGHDNSLQPEGGFRDKSIAPFINWEKGITNPRKRGREVSSVNNQTITVPMNPPHPPPRYNDHIQRLPPSNAVSDSLMLSSGGRQDQLQQQYNRREQLSSNFSMLSEGVAGEIKRQRDELEKYLQTQGDELRRTLVHYRQRHYRDLVAAADESVARRLKEKEAEIEKAARRNSELEARTAQLTAESRLWQARALALESEAISLQTRIQHAIASRPTTAVEEDVVGRGGGEEAEDAESGFVDPDRVVEAGPGCKICRTRVATVVALPCRHLVLCTECDGAAQACPVCWALKDSSVEVLLN